MPGHAFDKEMVIDDKGCLTPGGPLGLTDNERGLRLDVWIFQGNAACMAFLRDPKGKRWTMKPDPHDNHFGDMFRPGAAVGMGLLVKKVVATEEVIVEQWSAPVNLKPMQV